MPSILPKNFYENEYIEQELFLSILHHDQRNGNVIRLTLSDEENPEPRHFANKDLGKVMYFERNKNAYITLNTFKGYKRLSADVWNYNGLYIDLDGHSFSPEQLNNAIYKTEHLLEKAFHDGELLTPTMITKTGRGLGLFYILDRSIANMPSQKNSIKFLKDINRLLCKKYQDILAHHDNVLEVDTTVGDASRVVRLPGSINKKNGKPCELWFVNRDTEEKVVYYNLHQILEGNNLTNYFEERAKARTKLRESKIIKIDAYKQPFLTMRMKKLEQLQELRGYDCEGKREYMCFIYFNAAIQVLGYSSGVTALKAFNNAFNERIGDNEIEHIIKVVSTNKPPYGDYEGYYKLTDDYIMETLNVTTEENAVCNFGRSRRQLERAKRKEENQKRREERNNAVAMFIEDNPDITYQEIADEFEISEPMVRKIAKEYGIRRYKSHKFVLSASSNQNDKNMSQSLVGLSASSPADHSSDIVVEYSVASSSSREELLIEYAKLYTPILSEINAKKQVKGQLWLGVDSSGELSVQDS